NGITMNETNSALVTSHNITLTGLNDDTNYSYYITSTDRSGNSNTSSVQYFATSPFPKPNITSYSPSTPVFNLEGTQREFHINIDQISNVTWYLDGMNIGTNNSIYTAKYTNLDAVIGYWNVTASVTNVNGTDNQTWLWIVRGPSDSITMDADPSTIVANDEELSTITATIKDVQGNNVIDGTVVSFSTNRTSNDTLNTSTATTTNGEASITVKGNKAGVSRIIAENGQTSGSVDVTMIAGPVATISNISGMGLTGVINTALSAPFVFQINDMYYNPLTGVDVNFTVIGGNGASASTSTATSDADGRVSVTIALGNTQGTYGIMCEINGIPTINNTIETTAISKTPPDPVNLTHTTGNYWVKYTWSKGSNVSTDSYNVSLNGTWTNGSSATFSNTSVGSGGWANISVWAYYNEDNGYLSRTCISDEVQAPIRPGISSYGPQSPVSDTEEATRMFNIAIDQVVDVSWYINGTHVQTNLSTQSASYTNLSAISGIWNVSAIISNTNGTDIQTWIWNVREAKVVTIDLSLDSGWNMISIPIRPLDSSVDSVFADVNMFGNNIYEYQSNGYNIVSVVEPKIGYWVFSNDSRTITITGKITKNNISNLDPGWNMIGLSLNPSDPSINSVFASVNMFGKDVYTYNNTKSSYEKVTEVEPKVGYWIFSFGSNRIIYEGTTVTS
ncbi:MAG: invasin domain 3-containing protein, partial [Euryarchaeota archaeon]|nr:invasin domain 3-containing protein [Euryarchaeota archaeon]